MNPQKNRLLELIAFVQHTATHRLAGGPGRETLGRFRLDHQQLISAEGVRIGAAEPDDGAWLRVARPENPALPPRPESPWLSPWLDIGDPVLSSPRLATSVSGESLIAAGTHLDEDAAPGAGQGTARVRRDAVVMLEGYARRRLAQFHAGAGFAQPHNRGTSLPGPRFREFPEGGSRQARNQALAVPPSNLGLVVRSGHLREHHLGRRKHGIEVNAPCVQPRHFDPRGADEPAHGGLCGVRCVFGQSVSRLRGEEDDARQRLFPCGANSR